MEGQFQVYILRSQKVGRRYIGCTSDLLGRLDAHNKGLSQYTSRQGTLWSVEWVSRFLNHTEALKLEKLMKKQKGGKGLQLLMKQYDEAHNPAHAGS